MVGFPPSELTVNANYAGKTNVCTLYFKMDDPQPEASVLSTFKDCES